MKAPTQCAHWEKPELLDEPNRRDRFELLETFVDESHELRELRKCKECGQLYFYEFYEWINWEGGGDPQYQTYVPVETGAEIEMLKKALPSKLSEYLPQLRRDWPEDAESPKTYWALTPDRGGKRRCRNGSKYSRPLTVFVRFETLVDGPADFEAAMQFPPTSSNRFANRVRAGGGFGPALN